MEYIRRGIAVGIVIAVLVVLWVAMQPQPVLVDMGVVQAGALQVTIDEDGKTRIKDKYVVSAPVAGRMTRIEINPGDSVIRGATLLVTLEPTDPQLLNPRDLSAAEAREQAAEAAWQRAKTMVEKARGDLEFSESELGRKRNLRRNDSISETEFENAELLYRNNTEAFRAATFSAEIAKFELAQAQAALLPARSDARAPTAADWRFEIRAPIDGKVLRVFQESSAVVAAGAPLLELGDPHDLEIEIDVLSSDAVKIAPGSRVLIEHWGGSETLHARVRLVEPSAFTKISALGVEEQRVNVIADLVEPFDLRRTLGDGFRVEAKIVVWEADQVLRVPTSALFRDGDRWLVFAVVHGQAVRREVALGQRNQRQAEVLDGLAEGDVVVLHPSDAVSVGVRLERRNESPT